MALVTDNNLIFFLPVSSILEAYFGVGGQFDIKRGSQTSTRWEDQVRGPTQMPGVWIKLLIILWILMEGAVGMPNLGTPGSQIVPPPPLVQ